MSLNLAANFKISSCLNETFEFEKLKEPKKPWLQAWMKGLIIVKQLSIEEPRLQSRTKSNNHDTLDIGRD